MIKNKSVPVSAGDDVIRGGSGEDYLTGDDGDETLYGMDNLHFDNTPLRLVAWNTL